MRVNEHCLKHIARARKCDKEARFNYRSPKENYKERWFQLYGNLLIYFKTDAMGSQADKEPVGVLVLESYSVQLENLADRPFAFSIAFTGEGDKKHYFSGQTEQQCQDWVHAIKNASFSHIRAKLQLLQANIQQATGKDPLINQHKVTARKKHVHSSFHIPQPRIVNTDKKTRSVQDPFHIPASRAGWEQFN